MMDKEKWQKILRQSPFCTEYRAEDGTDFEICYRYDSENDPVVTDVAKVRGILSQQTVVIVPDEQVEADIEYYTDICKKGISADNEEEDYHGLSIAERNRSW